MNKNLTKEILKLIREYIKSKKISMSEFGRQTGVSKAWLSKLQNYDANLSLETATSLLDFMGYQLKLDKKGMRIYKSRLNKQARFTLA